MNITPINNQYNYNLYMNRQNRAVTFKAGQNYQSLYAELEKLAKDVEQKQPKISKARKFKLPLIQLLHRLLRHQKSNNTLSKENLKTDKYGWTELHYLCRDGYTDAVKNILKVHPNLNLNQLADGSSYVDIANYNGRNDIVNLIVGMDNYDPTVANEGGWTDLHHLCRDGRYKVVKTILKKHPDINLNQFTKSGYSYMYLAEHNKNSDIVNFLVGRKNYNPTIKNNYGWDDLHYLCQDGYTKAVKKILKKHPDIDINQTTNSGASYVKLAAKNNYEDIVNMLVSMKNYNPTVKDKNGWDDLHYLCYWGFYDAVKTILKKHPDIDINQLTNEGKSYIGLAKSHDNKKIVNLLAQYI